MGLYEIAANFDATDNMSGVAKNIAGALGNLEAAALSVAVAIGTTAFESMETMNHAMAGVQARTGETGEALADMRKQAEILFNTGLVENFDGAAQAAERAHIQFGELSKQDFSDFLRRAAGVGKAWDMTAKDVVNDVDDMVDTFKDLGGDPIKALDLLVVTAQKSQKPLDEVNNIVVKYGPRFAAAGVSAQGMSGMIAKSVDANITNFGALGTAIDKFHQNVANPPPAFKAAIRDLGMGQVVKDLNANKITMDQALDKIYAKFATMPDGPKKTADAVALFGKGIDKIGGTETLGKLSGFTDGFTKIQGAAEKVADVMEDDGTLGTAIQKFGNNLKTFLGDKAQETYDRIKSLDWKTVADSINVLADRAKQGWESLFGANGTMVKFAKDALQGLTDAVNGAVAGVGAAFGAVASAAVAALGPIVAALSDIIAKLGQIGGAGGAMGSLSGLAGLPNVAIPGHAGGNDVANGLFTVGEEGPELGIKQGSNVRIFSNSQSRQMVGSAGAFANGGSGQTINFNGTYHLYGAGGMGEFARMVNKAQQTEANRRGTRQ